MIKENYLRLPYPLRKQVALQICTGNALFLLFVMVTVFLRDIYLSFPCLLLAGFLLISGISLFLRGIRGGYVRVIGVCTEIETFGPKKKAKRIYVQAEQGSIKIPLRRSMKRLAAGDTVTVFLTEKTPVYPYDGGFLICSYLALELGEERAWYESGQGNAACADGEDQNADCGE